MITKRERELQMLQAVLDDGRLDDHDTEAFASMKHRLTQNKNGVLTDPQRNWVQDQYRRFELDAADTTNDVSEGRVAPPTSPMDFSAMGPKPTKPPGKSPRD
jgi:hypothetical protein